MGHTIQMIIGQCSQLDTLVARYAPAVRVTLPDGFAAVPMTDELWDLIVADFGSRTDSGPGRDVGAGIIPPGALLWESPALWEALADASLVLPVAYIETEYFGGVGSQAAVVARGGRIDACDVSAVSRHKPGRSGPINKALRALGVAAAAGRDEFDTLGLGDFRTMERLVDNADD